MTKSLDDELRHAIRHGLLHISLNKSWKGPDWEASYRNTDNTLISIVKDPDPIEALRKGMRLGSKQESLPSKNKSGWKLPPQGDPPKPERKRLL